MRRWATATCAVLALSCGKGRSNVPADAAVAGDASTTVSLDASKIERAADRRSGKELAAMLAELEGPEARAVLPIVMRRRIARALARVADESTKASLLRLLSDEDDEVVAWSAYGLGFACKIDPDGLVAALVARANTWSQARASDAGAARSSIDTAFAIARALGHCATAPAEKTLAAWLKSRGPLAEASTYALGDIATRKSALADESMTALLDAALPPQKTESLPSALFPFSRLPSIPDPFRVRVVEAARVALGEPGPLRIFAVRTLARAKAPDAGLYGATIDSGFTIAERVEAARGLGASGAKGHRAALDAMGKVAAKVFAATGTLATAEHHVLSTLLDAVRDGEIGREKTLYSLAALPVPQDRTTPLARRIEEIRCRAAGALARGEFDAEVLVACAPDGSEPRERATLRALLVGSLTPARRARYMKLARSANLRVREAAIEGAASHPELGVSIRPIVAEALASKKPGLVATAADLMRAHPTRFFGEDGRGQLSPEVQTAFNAALAEKWADDLIETRAALLDAAVAVGHARAKDLAQAACSDENVTMRQRGLKALPTLGAKTEKCEAREPAPAKELEALVDRPTKIALDIGGATLTLGLNPALAPVTSTRLAALARAGFFRGIVVHRVVPGFVVQLGDPGGDGYGGAGTSLRCETSPVPFQPLDIGMALAGRDTGSSQFFVTLSRTPHLDGEYAHVGRAEGDWENVIEGDVVTDARVL